MSDHRSGRLRADWITSIVMPEELEAMIEPGGVASSISANNFALKSGRSGRSLNKSALASAEPYLARNSTGHAKH